MSAIKVFVGTSPAGDDAEACAVLEHTLRKHASRPVDITWLKQSSDPGAPGHGWRSERWSTPWAGMRWAAPELAGWSGRAIYFDCAQIIMGDVAALAAAPMPEGAVVLLNRDGRLLHLACMVWDCERARAVMPPLEALRADVGGHLAVASMLADTPSLVGALPRGWAVGDQDFARMPEGATGSVHCGNLFMQPHARLALPRLRRIGRRHWFDEVRMRHFCPALVELFDREYAEAEAASDFSLGKYAEESACLT